jgi:hypothetical protein
MPEGRQNKPVRERRGLQKPNVGRSVRVIVPPDPPELTPGAARALLEILRELHERASREE